MIGSACRSPRAQAPQEQARARLTGRGHCVLTPCPLPHTHLPPPQAHQHGRAAGQEEPGAVRQAGHGRVLPPPPVCGEWGVYLWWMGDGDAAAGMGWVLPAMGGLVQRSLLAHRAGPISCSPPLTGPGVLRAWAQGVAEDQRVQLACSLLLVRTQTRPFCLLCLCRSWCAPRWLRRCARRAPSSSRWGGKRWWAGCAA